MNERILEFLVKQMGFTTLAFENRGRCAATPKVLPDSSEVCL